MQHEPGQWWRDPKAGTQDQPCCWGVRNGQRRTEREGHIQHVVALPGVKVGILVLIDRNRVAQKRLDLGANLGSELGHINLATIPESGQTKMISVNKDAQTRQSQKNFKRGDDTHPPVAKGLSDTFITLMMVYSVASKRLLPYRANLCAHGPQTSLFNNHFEPSR